MNSVNVLEEGKYYPISSVDSQVIAPSMTFSCNGTITGLTVNLTDNKDKESTNAGNHTGGSQDGGNKGDDRDNDGNEEDERDNDGDEEDNDGGEGDNGEDEGDDNEDKGEEEKNDKVDDERRDTDSIKSFPSIQVWRPLNSKSLYTRVGQYTICVSDIKIDGNLTLAEVSLTANKSISFQSHDIIGYYVPANSPYSILNIRIMEGISYSINTNTTLEQFAVNESVTGSSMLPIIQVTFGK